MVVVERDVDRVVSDLRRKICHVARPVPIIPTINGSFAGTFDGNTKSTLTGASGIDHELRRSVDDALNQTRPAGLNLTRVGSNKTLQSEGLGSYRRTTETYTEKVLSKLGRSEIDEETFGCGNDVRFDAIPRRTGDGYGEVGLADAVRNHSELLKTVQRCR